MTDQIQTVNLVAEHAQQRARIAELEAENARLRVMVGEEATKAADAATKVAALAIATARREALGKALAARHQADHGVSGDAIAEGSYHAGWDDGVAAYAAAIRALMEGKG